MNMAPELLLFMSVAPATELSFIMALDSAPASGRFYIFIF